MRTLSSPARFVSGALSGHVPAMLLTSWASLVAIYAVEFLGLYYLGSLGDPLILGAVGLASMIQFLVTSVFACVSVAGTVLVSRALGGGRAARARALATSSLALIAVTGVVASALLLLALPTILDTLAIEPALQAPTLRYAWIAVPFMPVMGLGMMLASLLRAAGRGRAAMGVVLAGTGAAAILDPIAIYVLDAGLDGVAVAGGVARIVTAVLGGWCVRRLVAPVRWRRLPGDWRALGRVAVPAVLTALATPVAVVFTAAVFARFGGEVMAGATVVDRILQLAFAAFFVLPPALAPIIGQNAGARRMDRVRQTISIGLAYSLVYGVAIAALLAWVAPWLPARFGLTGTAAELVRFFCVWGALGWASNAPYFVAVAVFNTLGHARQATAISWLRATLGTIPFVWMGARLGGPNGVIVGQSLGYALFGVLSLLLARRVLHRARSD